MTRKRSRIGLGGGFRVLAVATRQNVWAPNFPRPCRRSPFPNKEAALARRISRAKSGAAACAQTLKSLGVEEIYIDALITLAGPFQTADRFRQLEGTGIDLDRFVPVKTPCSRARTAAPSIGPSSPPNL
jgi:hypothetical protein